MSLPAFFSVDGEECNSALLKSHTLTNFIQNSIDALRMINCSVEFLFVFNEDTSESKHTVCAQGWGHSSLEFDFFVGCVDWFIVTIPWRVCRVEDIYQNRYILNTEHVGKWENGRNRCSPLTQWMDTVSSLSLYTCEQGFLFSRRETIDSHLSFC